MEESRRGEKQKGVAGWLVGGWPGLASSGLVWSGLAGLAWLAGDERDASRNEKSLPPFRRYAFDNTIYGRERWRINFYGDQVVHPLG